MTELKNRYELVFLYDVRDANPNGDPDTSNMPRMDDNTGENIVTDVRLKRTIRDYWLSQGKNVLIRAETNEDGTRKSMDGLATDYLGLGKITKKNAGEARTKIANEMPKYFIDVRCFGAAVTLSNANFSITGPVQFGLGRSLNLPQIQTRTITTTLAAGEGKGQGTIGSYHTVDYSLIRFHGLVSEITAGEVGFSEADLEDLLTATWNGTKQLNTRSKFNHLPRLLLMIKSNENKTQIGDLDLCFNLNDKENISSISDAKLDITKLIERITEMQDAVESISIKIDNEVQLTKDENMITHEDFMNELSAMELKIEE
jgi:CRISPR-associated protein Csh2